ncbi:MAG: ABC transporter permease [Ruminococcaceae bacterium]|nr:ABC transporter permease [Oscillospiraceae bacterium]
MSLFLAFKRVLKKSAVLIMLAAIFVCILLCGFLTKDDGIPNCGVVSSSDKNAVTITEWLVRDGLVRYESESALKKAINRGEVASGIVFPDDFTERLVALDTDEILTFYEAPNSLFRSLFKFRAAAYVMDVYAPYLLSRLIYFEGADISYEQMRAEIEKYIENDEPFEFTFENAEGALLKVEHYSSGLAAGVVALFLFFAFSIFAIPYTEKQFLKIAQRIGFKKAFCSFTLPSVFVTMALFFTVTAAALCLSEAIFNGGTASYIGAAAVYTVFLSALGIAVTAVFGSTEKVRVPVMAICLLSVALCPIFVDIPAILELNGWALHLLPTMFFYTAGENLPLCTVIAICSLAIAMWMYIMRFKKNQF